MPNVFLLKDRWDLKPFFITLCQFIVECQDLVCKILTTDPQKRATLQDIARHPWLTVDETAEEVSIFNAFTSPLYPNRFVMQ